MRESAFSQGNSLLHRVDPAIKIVIASALIIVLATAKTFTTAAAGIALGIFLVGIARLHIRQVLHRLFFVNGFVAFLVITLPLTYPGEVLARIGPFTCSRQGILLAGLIGLKANAVLLVSISLLATSSVASLGSGMQRLGIPGSLCQIFLFSYRYLFVIQQEFDKLLRAARVRCFTASTSIHTYRTYGNVLGMTLVSSWNRARRVEQAMLLRGFHGRFYSLDEGSLALRDFVVLAVGLVCVTCLGVIEFLG